MVYHRTSVARGCRPARRPGSMAHGCRTVVTNNDRIPVARGCLPVIMDPWHIILTLLIELQIRHDVLDC